MNCIDQQAIYSLGNRMNQVYSQVNEFYSEQLQMKSQIAEIQLIQQQTLQALGSFVTQLNEKIESVDNFHMLITEIQQGRYSDSSKLYSLCNVLAQLDKRTLDDSRKLGILKDAMLQSKVIDDAEMSISEYLMHILSLPEDKIGVMYLELCNFRNSFPANLFADMIESYHFLSKMEKMSKKKELIVQKLLDKYKLDESAEFSIDDILESFLENKISSFTAISTETLEWDSDEDTEEYEEDDGEYEEDEEDEEYEEDEYDPSCKTEQSLRYWANFYDSDAMEDLGYALYYGEYDDDFGVDGIEEDKYEAAVWFESAAKAGMVYSQKMFADMCFNGEGVQQNYQRALKWYKKAAAQRNGMSYFMLYKMYSNGLGCSEDTDIAYKCYVEACDCLNDGNDICPNCGSCNYSLDEVSSGAGKGAAIGAGVGAVFGLLGMAVGATVGGLSNNSKTTYCTCALCDNQWEKIME